METYLITGGAGFIGVNLVRRLIKRQGKIHIFAIEHESLWRLHHVEERITVHRVDLRNHNTVQQLIEQIRPTIIFHLASYGGMPDQLEQKMIVDVNFLGTINLLNACKMVGFDCFINTGSSSEFGMKNHPMSEEDVLEPVSDYAVAKAAATQFCLKEALKNNLPIYTLRPFSVYGPYEAKSRLIPTVLLGAIQSQPIHLSSPNYVRDFIYIDDVIDLYLAIANQKPQGAYIFNAGSGIESTIGDVVATVEKIVGKPCEVVWGKHQPRPWEPTCWQASVTRAHQVLSWQPRYSLGRGLKVSYMWIMEQGVKKGSVHEKTADAGCFNQAPSI